MSGQWRTIPRYGARPIWLGLDYAACAQAFQLAGMEVTPDLWAEIRVVEQGAKQALNGE